MAVAGLSEGGDLTRILCLNSGSSTLKYALYEARGGTLSQCLRGSIRSAEASEPLLEICEVLESRGVGSPDMVGHRVVHGGARHNRPEQVDEALLQDLEALIPLAPVHLPEAIRMIRGSLQQWPGAMQVVCFDTAFHRRIPDIAQHLPLTRALWDQGVRRYGFHGLSYEFIVDLLQPAEKQRTIIAHLGNGASLAALRGARPVDTTMGLTPAGGVMMGTRSGDLDPGVVLYLIQQLGMEPGEVARLINHQSGLLGVSGLDSDMRTLLEHRETNERARLAVDMFCYSVRAQIGAFAAVLGGLDALVFTGGIGEHRSEIRAWICSGLEFLGIRLDESLNTQHAQDITAAGAPCQVRVLSTEEDLVIARHCLAIRGS